MILIIEPAQMYTSKIVKGQTYCEKVILRDRGGDAMCLISAEDINEMAQGRIVDLLNQGESVTVELTMEAVED